MDDYLSERDQVEALKKWWDENGKSVIAGVLLGLGALFGWQKWQDHVRSQAEYASEIYQELMVALGNQDEQKRAGELAEELIDEHPASAYAVFASMALAHLAVEDEDYARAADHLRKAMAETDDKNLEPLIRMRLATVLNADGNHQAALSLLNEKDPGPYAAAYDELRGDINRAMGDTVVARTSYQQALEKYRLQQSDTVVLEMKLDGLGSPSL